MTYEWEPVSEIADINDALRDIDTTLDPGAWQYPDLLNSWDDYGTPYESCRFRKDGNGIVHLAGVVDSGTIGQPIFRLPVRHLPEGELLFPVPSNSLFGILTVEADGDVICSVGNNTSVSLSGVYFRARQ